MADLAHATEYDTDLIGDHDAAHWAERFAAKFTVVRRQPDQPPLDTEDLMLTWFASAIGTGEMPRCYRSALGVWVHGHGCTCPA